jgi:hypothetical protein
MAVSQFITLALDSIANMSHISHNILMTIKSYLKNFIDQTELTQLQTLTSLFDTAFEETILFEIMI